MHGYDEENERVWITCDQCDLKVVHPLHGPDEWTLPSDEDIDNTTQKLIKNHGWETTASGFLVCSNDCHAEAERDPNEGLPNPWGA